MQEDLTASARPNRRQSFTAVTWCVFLALGSTEQTLGNILLSVNKAIDAIYVSLETLKAIQLSYPICYLF